MRAATGPAGVAALLRALGFPARSRLPCDPPDAWGLAGVPGVRRVLPGGERGGLAALVIELEDGEPEAVARVARRVRAHNPARLHLFVFAGPDYRRLTLATFGLGEELRQLVLDRAEPKCTDLEALAELVPEEGEGGVALAVRHARALDRSRVTRQFFRDFRAQRARIAAAWTGIAPDAVVDRAALALLLLSRLLFLYFLQKEGHLAGDPSYLSSLLNRWRRAPREGTFYRAVLGPLFFGALNTRPERRDAAARALGDLPYLNGGLFERHVLERRHPELDLPDDVLAGAFDGLLERYRFTTREAVEAAADEAGELGVDPEMLGRVFEGLMAAERRGATGTFYTPAGVVNRLVREALAAYLAGKGGLQPEEAATLVRGGGVEWLDKDRRRRLARVLEGVRVLDPACGSGAFLLGALSRISRLRCALTGGDPVTTRRDVVARTLHGVDVQEDAALLCALRLWLALALGSGPGASPGTGREPVPPLPNLDRRIRQGDALVGPLDLMTEDEGIGSMWREAGWDHQVRRAVRAIEPLASRYLTAEPGEKQALQEALVAAEAALARAWLQALDRRMGRRLAELCAQAEARDLFGERPPEARRAEAARRALEARRAEIARLRESLDEAGVLPFFSFGVHFAEAAAEGFDLILSNPPWVRAHRWPGPIRRLVRRRYAVCREAGWRRGAALAGAPGGVAAQVDLSLLFLERSLRLLSPGGVLAMLVPAKVLRSLYGGGARRLLLRETTLVALEDHSLDQRSIFQADAYAAAVVAMRNGDGDGERAGSDARPRPGERIGAPAVRVTLIRRDAQPLRFAVTQDELPLIPGDLEAPWLLAPPAARAALRRMQAAGPPLGARAELRVRRGVVTGANEVLLVREAEPKLGGYAWIRAEGYFRARRAGQAAPESRRYEALIEGSALRPLVRGSGIAAWRYRTAGHVVWVHDDATAAALPPPPHAARYLARHAARLQGRSGWRPGLPLGAVFRLSRDTLSPKVAWHDLAETLKAVALPARTRGIDGLARPLVPLNTVYFIPTAREEDALLLAAFFNSLPVRTFARAIAERAKDARFRFFAWTIALLPLPDDWNTGPVAERLLRISREAHRRGGLQPEGEAELNATVAALYRLTGEDLDALVAFDRWLRGERAP